MEKPDLPSSFDSRTLCVCHKTLSIRQRFLRVAYLRITTFLALWLTALTVFLLAPTGFLSPPKDRSTNANLHYGKTLSPSNYTVIKGVFIQDSPTFNTTGYNLLNDSFGLIDKSARRWQNFTE